MSFPKDMPNKICANFTCKGQECTRENCSFGHQKNMHELKPNTIAAIVQHFKSKKIGWLTEWHWRNADLANKAKDLMASKNGPSSSRPA
jgi:hypothetical protein